MLNTLVSFLGTGRSQAGPGRAKYEKTTYVFSHSSREFDHTTSLFGAGLLRHLRDDRGLEVPRWLVLGTSASQWSELYEAVPEHQQADEHWCRMDEKVLQRAVEPEDLKTWQDHLNATGSDSQFRLELVGPALERTSQNQICRAMFDHIPRGHDVVFDISHGFRHQPVIASFVVSLMRRTHDIRNVSFFSGVFEAREGNRTPVIELPICQELLEAAECTAVLQLTGNYTPLAERLGVDASGAWFFENTNQLHKARKQGQEVLKQMRHLRDAPEPVDAEAARVLMPYVEWVGEANFAGRLRARAAQALRHGDFHQAAILAYEGLLVEQLRGMSSTGNADPLSFENRDRAQEEIFATWTGKRRQTFVHLKQVRNACAHGSRSDVAEAQHILDDPAAFQKMLQQVFKLWKPSPARPTRGDDH